MSKPETGRRGAGVNRSGATDTTMLIWKTIDANPGITRDEIFGKIEHEIPAGWAKRRYAAMEKHRGKIKALENDPARVLILARRYVLSNTLSQMKYLGSVHREGDGYSILRALQRYAGNRDHIDETGTKAAEHINRAYAERTLYAAGRRLAQMYGEDIGAARLTRAETKAFMIVFGPRDNVPSSTS